MHAIQQIKKSLGWLLIMSASCAVSAMAMASTTDPSSKNPASRIEKTDKAVNTSSVNPSDATKKKSTETQTSTTAGASSAVAANANAATDVANPSDTPAAENDDAAPAVNHDPYERFNRAMFQFNETFDILVMKPIATLYIKIIPKPLSKGLSNFYNNIDTIPTVANDVLQANFYQGTSDAWRLAINSSIGILGFFDVATDMGLEPNKEDFGLTLAQWGYRNSNYLVLPFLGPGTVRDQIGWPINYLFLTIYPYIYPVTQRNELYLTGLVVKRAELLRYQNVLEEASLDDYTFIRDAYMQRRAYQLERNAELNDPYLEKNNKSEQNADTTLDQNVNNKSEQDSTTTSEQKEKTSQALPDEKVS